MIIFAEGFRTGDHEKKRYELREDLVYYGNTKN